MAPNNAAPRAEPIARQNMLVPVTTPRRSQPTTDCTATTVGDEDSPIPSPVRNIVAATCQTGAFADPNHGINDQGDAVFDYTSQVKLDGTYRVPAFGGFNVSAVYRYTTGLAWGRIATIRGLAQGNEVVRIEPRGTRRTDPINNVDFRVEKTFPVGASDRRIGVYLDIFNVNNQGVIDNGVRTGVIDSSGTTFGNPNNWINPRLARLGVRFTF